MELLSGVWRVLSNLSNSELLEAKPYVLQSVHSDWAGREVTYPAFMNPKVAWLAGAQPFAVRLSLTEHDVALLR